MVEEARLESVYTPKGYPGFESPSLRSDSESATQWLMMDERQWKMTSDRGAGNRIGSD